LAIDMLAGNSILLNVVHHAILGGFFDQSDNVVSFVALHDTPLAHYSVFHRPLALVELVRKISIDISQSVLVHVVYKVRPYSI